MKTFLLGTIERALNSYIHSDSESAKLMTKMTGKTISIELLPLNLSFNCHFTKDHISVSAQNDVEPHTKIKGTPLQLLGAIVARENRHQFFADDLSIEGDAEFAQQVITLFDNINIDWENQASRFIGDIPAYRLGKLISGVQNWLGKTNTDFSEDVKDYLHEEAAWFPAKNELQEFFKDIDNIRMDADRLESRLAQLKSDIEKEEIQ